MAHTLHIRVLMFSEVGGTCGFAAYHNELQELSWRLQIPSAMKTRTLEKLEYDFDDLTTFNLLKSGQVSHDANEWQ